MSLRNTLVKTLMWLVFLIGVHLSIVLLWQRDDAVTASQWGDNRIRTERFLYEWDQKDCVLVGSSMSANLPALMENPMSDMPDIRVMAYAAGSAIDGLEVIVSSDKAPRCVLVEANLSYKELDSDFISDTFNPVWYPLKRYVASLRYENYPMNLFLTFVKSLTTTNAQESLPLTRETFGDTGCPNDTANTSEGGGTADTTEAGGAADIDCSADTVSPVESAPAHLIKERIEGLAWADEKVLARGVEAQLAMVNLLNQRGTTVLFYVMPGETEVRASNYYQILGNAFEQAGFPSATSAADEHALHIIDAGLVGTNDGIHLNAQSLQKIPEQLFKLVNESL